MPVTGCTWRSSPNAPGCWDRGEPPRPVRAGGENPPDSGTQGRRPDPLRRVVAANLGVSPWGPPLSPAWSLLASVWGPAVVVSDAGSGLGRLRRGLLHEGGDLLPGGCAYCTKVPPTRSTPDPPPVAPDPRAVDDRRHSSDCEQPGHPLPGRRVAAIEARPTHRCLGTGHEHPALRRRGRGHPARAGTFLCGRGQMTRAGTGLLSPTASNAPARKDTHPAAWNAPARKDTHPAAWNAPLVGDGQLDEGVQRLRTHLKARGLYPQGPYSQSEVCSR